MNAASIMNSPVTRIQVFAVWALCALMAIGTLGYVSLRRVEDRPTQVVLGAHGIETTWPSASGENRLWSLSSSRSDFHPWIAEHLTALAAAQEALPPVERK